ncbi:MAG TPA: alpha/beta fold hydrolase [Thermoleophilaceae bacterium]|nr:alpha/beta fold hydrolase [Thermoleophilaceae bacterium]
MSEQFCTVGDVEICYETFGEPGRPALLLIIGLGTQMIVWHDDFCRALAERGFFVIRYDNRDVGRSTRFDGVSPPARRELLLRRPAHLAYTLADMARDGAGLLAHLGLHAAHVVGASMGGMIAQDLAARHPRRVQSLVSIMSSTGSRWAGQPALRAYPYFLRDFFRSAPASKEEYVDRAVRFYRFVGSPAFDRDEQALRDMVALSFDRGWSPAGTARQMAAVIAAGNRSADLSRIQAPTLVIHGTADRLAAPSGARATARAIPGARLMLIEGMGHGLPRALWPRVVGAIADNAARAPELDARLR